MSGPAFYASILIIRQALSQTIGVYVFVNKEQYKSLPQVSNEWGCMEILPLHIQTVNRLFLQWQHLTKTTRIYLVFAFSLKFINPAED